MGGTQLSLIPKQPWKSQASNIKQSYTPVSTSSNLKFWRMEFYDFNNEESQLREE
jgi:regulation of enolase protein 1 (concanavalin A-like superfamily)